MIVFIENKILKIVKWKFKFIIRNGMGMSYVDIREYKVILLSSLMVIKNKVYEV